MPKSKGRKAKPVTTQRLRIRPAASPTELQQFRQWAELADAGGELTATALVESHAAGLLGAALRTDDHDLMRSVLHSNGIFYAALTRSMALVAARGDHILGGMFAGPAAYLLENLQQPFGLTDDVVLRAMQLTCKLHFISVAPAFRGRGVGAALLRAAIARAAAAGTALMYGQFPAVDRNLANFYRSNGFDLMMPETPLNFAPLLAGAPVTPHPSPGEQFFVRSLHADAPSAPAGSHDEPRSSASGEVRGGDQ